MSREEWEAAATAGTYTPLSPERLDEMWQHTQSHGPPNCWSGTSGRSAAMIRELLRERAHLVLWLAEEIEG